MCLAPQELTAAVLDGDLVRVGDAFLPVDLPIGPRERAAVLSTTLGTRIIAARRTAAWVWGARWQLPEPLEGYRSLGLGSMPRDPLRVRLHQVRLAEGDVTMLGDMAVTSPLRTVMDLAMAPGAAFDEHVVRRLLATAGLAPQEVAAALEARPRLRGRLDALRRLQLLLTR